MHRLTATPTAWRRGRGPPRRHLGSSLSCRGSWALPPWVWPAPPITRCRRAARRPHGATLRAGRASLPEARSHSALSRATEIYTGWARDCGHVRMFKERQRARQLGRSSFPIAFWSGDKIVKCLSPLTVFALHSASPAIGGVLRPAAGTAAMVGRPRMPASSWAAVPRRPFTSSDTRQQGWLRRKFRVCRQSAAVDPCVERVR